MNKEWRETQKRAKFLRLKVYQIESMDPLKKQRIYEHHCKVASISDSFWSVRWKSYSPIPILSSEQAEA